MLSWNYQSMLKSRSELSVPIVIGGYRLVRQLGSGTFSRVFEAIAQDESRVAVKLTSKQQRRSEEIHDAEVEALMRLRGHVNVIQLLDVLETDNDWVLVLEFIDGCDLFKYVSKRGRLSRNHAFHLLAPVAKALSEAHINHRVAHRDLKLENIVVERETGRAVLIDFGLAVHYDTLLTMRCGSEDYVAPEIISGKAYYGERADVWSFGVVLYACLHGRLPFTRNDDVPAHSSDPTSLYSQIISGEIDSNEPLLLSIINTNDSQRPTFATIFQTMHNKANFI